MEDSLPPAPRARIFGALDAEPIWVFVPARDDRPASSTIHCGYNQVRVPGDINHAFVHDGGLLVVATGYEERRGAEALLADFGYAIGPAPIGAAHQSVTYLEGHRAMMHEAWPVVRPEERGEVWVSCWGYPLVTFERIGTGGLLVVGDSRFLTNSKLESMDAYIETNIDFLRAALETARRQMNSGDGE